VRIGCAQFTAKALRREGVRFHQW